jgi:type IV pilus assembly protein PilQ
MLEILVVEFTDFDADVFDLGLRWDNAGEGLEFGTFPLPVQHPLLPLPTLGSISLRGIADLPDGFRVTLEALVSKRRARVRAAPRIATVSGQWASFFVGTQRYLRQPVEMPDGNISNYIDAGVRLNVAPWTGDGQEIICDVRPEVSTLSAPDPITGLPEKATRTANTTVRVRSGQTIIIGGLQQEEERVVRSKVPVLGSLPLLGNLFRSRNIFRSKTDLVIFITPCVLSQTGHLSPQEEQRLREQFLPE